jgi:adenylosuccinate synthase
LVEQFGFTDFNLESMEEEFFTAVERLRKFKFVNSEYLINEHITNNDKILAEGAQGSMLDIDFGSYPFVTSSNTTVGGVTTGLGIAPKHINKVIGIFKAYCTRVGGGPFPSELDNEVGQRIRDVGNEYGATTGRPRRTGWLDLVALKYAIMLSGVDELCMMKADCLSGFDEVLVATSYKGDLMRHKQRIHEGVKHKCSLCDFSTGCRSHLKGHLRQKHNEGEHSSATSALTHHGKNF